MFVKSSPYGEWESDEVWTDSLTRQCILNVREVEALTLHDALRHPSTDNERGVDIKLSPFARNLPKFAYA